MEKNIFVIFTILLGIVARGMYADDPMYKSLDRSNTKIQVNMNK